MAFAQWSNKLVSIDKRPNCMRLYQQLSVFFCFFIVASSAFGNDRLYQEPTVDVEQAIEKFIIDENEYVFYGLASYYNNIDYYIINKTSMSRVEAGNKIVLQDGDWLAVVSRLNVMLVKLSGLSITLKNLNLSVNSLADPIKPFIKIVPKHALSTIATELDQIRYRHLWRPLAWLAKVVEHVLVFIHENIYKNWGGAIIIFSVLLKLILLPLSVMTVKSQRKVSQIQTKLAPILAEIKALHRGEKAHNLLMAAYKNLGVSPFYTLRPMLSLFVQIPILIAVFNVLGEMSQLDEQSIFWIKKLTYPDAVGHLPFSLPLFGNTISLLPVVMTVVTLYSTVTFKNQYASAAEIKRQKFNLYLMSATFFFLFYPFPAAMVLYWTLANSLHAIQQRFIKI